MGFFTSISCINKNIQGFVIADSLKNVLVSWIKSNFVPIEIAYSPGLQLKKEFDKATEERLRSLGYIK